jgi:dimethylargininase
VRVISTATTVTSPFVTNDGARLGAALLVRPGAAIERARPVQGESGAIFTRALEQFRIFEGTLKYYGVRTVAIDATEGLPHASAVADLAVVFPAGAFLMRPSDVARRAELPAVEAALAAAGVPIVGRIEAPGLLDGGDVLLGAQALYLGVTEARAASVGIPTGRRGNAHGREQLAAYARGIGRQVVEVPLAAEAVRLRSVAAFVDEETLVYAPGLVPSAAFAGLATLEVPRGDDYGAGVLALGQRRVIGNLRFRAVVPLLRAAKIAVDAIDLWEFGKIGTTPSLLALALKRA